MTLRVVFMGSAEFSVPALRALHRSFDLLGVVTQPDRPRGRGQKSTPTPVKAAALELGLPVREPEHIRSEEFLAELRAWAPDIIVVVAYGRVLPLSVLQLPRMGCVNIHASLLPRHRGAAPISAAVLAGDSVTGVTAMLMDEGLDTGDILLSHEIAIESDDTTGSLHDRLMELGGQLVVETLRRMEEGTLEQRPQDHSLATFTRPLVKEDGRIDWNMSAVFLDRHVRAMNPWPGAFTFFAGEAIKIWKASPVNGSGLAGMITEVGPHGILVGTSEGLLLLREVQAPGKKRVAAPEFARGRHLRAGDAFQDKP
ncbi:MAG: methionyl-tRNA formyltransferase [Desulfomonile sp.]|nr:methionyl-tRNA formyltransferase [Desulfomonile sp.]